jgi:hypothetical protein
MEKKADGVSVGVLDMSMPSVDSEQGAKAMAGQVMLSPRALTTPT